MNHKIASLWSAGLVISFLSFSAYAQNPLGSFERVGENPVSSGGIATPSGGFERGGFEGDHPFSLKHGRYHETEDQWSPEERSEALGSPTLDTTPGTDFVSVLMDLLRHSPKFPTDKPGEARVRLYEMAMRVSGLWFNEHCDPKIAETRVAGNKVVRDYSKTKPIDIKDEEEFLKKVPEMKKILGEKARNTLSTLKHYNYFFGIPANADGSDYVWGKDKKLDAKMDRDYVAKKCYAMKKMAGKTSVLLKKEIALAKTNPKSEAGTVDNKPSLGESVDMPSTRSATKSGGINSTRKPD